MKIYEYDTSYQWLKVLTVDWNGTKVKAVELVAFGWVYYDAYEGDAEADYDRYPDCIFYVPYEWLCNYLKNDSYFEEFIQDGRILDKWEDTYTHEDGVDIYEMAKSQGVIISASLTSDKF